MPQQVESLNNEMNIEKDNLSTNANNYSTYQNHNSVFHPEFTISKALL